MPRENAFQQWLGLEISHEVTGDGFAARLRLPLLELSPRTDLVLEELWLQPRDFLYERIVNLELLSGGEYAAEQLAHYLLVVCNAVLARTVLVR